MTNAPAVTQATAAHVRHFRMRGLDVTFESDSPDIDAGLACLVNHADEWETPERHVRFRLTGRTDGRVGLAENGRETAWTRSLPEALAVVHDALGTHFRGLYERRTFLHAGAVTIDGRLVIVAGHRGAGKTTLLIRLTLDGAEFHGDEHVMASPDGLARTVPRRLHVKPGTFVCLPEIEKACRAQPLLVIPGGMLFYPLDLADLGVRWRSASRPASAIVHLTPAFDEAPVVTRIAEIESVKRLFHQAAANDMVLGRQAADICGVVRGVPCYELRVGNVRATADTLRRTVAGLPCA